MIKVTRKIGLKGLALPGVEYVDYGRNGASLSRSAISETMLHSCSSMRYKYVKCHRLSRRKAVHKMSNAVQSPSLTLV